MVYRLSSSSFPLAFLLPLILIILFFVFVIHSFDTSQVKRKQVKILTLQNLLFQVSFSSLADNKKLSSLSVGLSCSRSQSSFAGLKTFIFSCN